MSDLHKQIAEGASAAVKHLSGRPETFLDYSEQSLAVVEEVLAEIASYGDQLDPKDLDGLVSLIGAYILETAVRAHGGASIGMTNTISRCSGDEADNIPFFYEGFAGRVRSATKGVHVIYV